MVVADGELVVETPTEFKHAVLKLALLPNAEVRVTEIILQALEARIVGLKVVRLRQLLLFGGWVRGCARLFGVHSAPLLAVGRVPRSGNSCGAISFSTHLCYHRQ
jgi:hypothetical protein